MSPGLGAELRSVLIPEGDDSVLVDSQEEQFAASLDVLDNPLELATSPTETPRDIQRAIAVREHMHAIIWLEKVAGNPDLLTTEIAYIERVRRTAAPTYVVETPDFQLTLVKESNSGWFGTSQKVTATASQLDSEHSHEIQGSRASQLYDRAELVFSQQVLANS
jgi:hypothetical protein